MTVIRVDAATLARVRAGQEAVFLADESGQPALELAPAAPGGPNREPQLTEEEWRQRMDPTNGKTTAEVLAYLKTLGTP